MRKAAEAGVTVANFAAMFIVGVVFLDVIGSKFFKRPLEGSYELVTVAQLIAIGFSGANTFLVGRHVQVEMLVDKMPTRLRKSIIAFVTALGLLTFAVLAYEGFLYGESLRRAGEVSGTIYIPLFPFAYVLAVSSGLMVLVLLLYFRENLKGRV